MDKLLIINELDFHSKASLSFFRLKKRQNAPRKSLKKLAKMPFETLLMGRSVAFKV